MMFALRDTVRRRLRLTPAVFTIALAVCLSSLSLDVLLAADILTIYETEPPNGLDAYTGRGLVSRRFVSLYCRPLFQFKYPSEYSKAAYDPQLADPLIVGDKNPGAFKVSISKNAYFFFFKEEAEENLVKDSIKVRARDVVATYRNLRDQKSELGSDRCRDIIGKYVADIKAVTDDTVMVALKLKPRQEEIVLDFPVVPESVLPTSPVLANPPKNSPFANYQKKPWGCGPFALREHVVSPDGNAKWIFERMSSAKGDEGRNIRILSATEDHLADILSGGGSLELICVPSVPLGKINKVGKNFNTSERHYPTVEQVMFNTRKDGLNDERVRAALSLYINRNSLKGKYNDEAYPVTGPMPYQYPTYCHDCDIPYYAYNVKLADSLMRLSGWEKDRSGKWAKNGQRLQIEIMGWAGSANSTVAQIVTAIQSAWENGGVTAASPAQIVPQAEYWRRLKEGKFDAAFHVLMYDNYYPEIDLYFTTKAKENYGGFTDPVVDSLWKALLSAPPTEIRALYHKLHERIGRLVPGAFLWTPKNYAAYSKWIETGEYYYPDNFIGQIEKWRW